MTESSAPSVPSVSAAPEDEIEARLREIEGELAAVFAQGPRGWWWSRSYELPGDPDALEKHWALTNAESEADGKVVSGWLVLATTAAHDYDGRPLDETRHLRLIAHAPEHLDWALAQIHALRSRLTAAETERDEARKECALAHTTIREVNTRLDAMIQELREDARIVAAARSPLREEPNG